MEKRLKDDLFYAALSGFVDAEGHISPGNGGGYAKGREPSKSIFLVSNTNNAILQDFQRGLRQRGLRTGLRKSRDGIERLWELWAFNRNALNLLPKLDLRHPENVIAKQLVLANWDKPWAEVNPFTECFVTVSRSRGICVCGALNWPISTVLG